MEEDLKSKLKVIIDKFLGREDIDKVIKNEIFNEIDLENICNKIFNENKENTIINSDVLIDLEIFEGLGNDKDNTIFNYINKTKTQLGKYLLKRILKNPIKDVKLLQSRQNIIEKFKNQDLLKQLDDKLENIKNNEENLLWLWKDMSDETKQLFGMVYFQKRCLKFLNRNEFAMKMYNYYVIIFSPMYGILSPILMCLAPFIFIKYYFKTEVSLSLYFKLFKVAISGIRNITKVDITQDSKTTYTQIISIIIWLVFYIHSLFSNIELAKNTNKITNIIHSKVNSISKLVREGFSLYELTSNDINENSKLISCDVKKVFNILWRDIYDKKPIFYSNKGLILKTYKDLEEKKEKLTDILKYISIVDCYVSLSKLLSENNYCFPEYTNNSIPILKVKDLWYPVLEDKDNNIKNSITLGGFSPLNALITGPNAGGKSTFIKSLALCVLFSQTISIVPASEFKITPFTIINTYLNIPDSKGKESLYEAEMRRALEQINKIKNLKEDEFSFVILDEIFNSTNPEEGIGAAYAVAEELSNHKNSISLITSHYSYLSRLELNLKYVNYKIPITRDKDNNIVYKYKLVKGISDQFIALELLGKKGFDKRLVNRAQNICKEVSYKQKNIKLRKRKKPLLQKLKDKKEEEILKKEEEFMKNKEVKAEETKKLKLEENKEVKVKDTKEVKVEETKKLKLEENKELKVKDTKEVKVEETKKVKVEDTKEVKVKDTKEVKVKDTKEVKETKEVELEETENKKVKESKKVEVKEK